MRNETETVAHRHGAGRDDYESGVGASDRMELRVWLRLITCFNLLDGAVRQSLHQSHATTLPRFDVLAQLYRTSAPMSMGELSRRLMVTNANITGLIDRLVGEELVERQPAPSDRRAQMVRLTPAGKAAFHGMAPVHQKWIHGMLEGLGRDELEALHDLLGKLKDSCVQARGNGNQGEGA